LLSLDAMMLIYAAMMRCRAAALITLSCRLFSMPLDAAMLMLLLLRDATPHAR